MVSYGSVVDFGGAVWEGYFMLPYGSVRYFRGALWKGYGSVRDFRGAIP
jgi:hypothetical protein